MNDAGNDAVRALAEAIHANEHGSIRGILAQNPGVKWDSEYEVPVDCDCCGVYRCRLSNALFGSTVTIETCRLLYDLGLTGPQNCGFLLSFWTSSAAIRNLFAMCAWYDPATLAQLHSEEDGTLIRASITASVGARSQQLRAPYIAWLNMLLGAQCPLPVKDEFALAVVELYVDDVTRTVYDAMPELQTDAALFRKWRRRYFNHCIGLQIDYGDEIVTMAQRRSDLREVLEEYPLDNGEQTDSDDDSD